MAETLPPIGKRAIKLYKVACARLVDLEKRHDEDMELLNSVKEGYRDLIKDCEGTLGAVACVHTPEEAEVLMLRQEILMLHKAHYFVRYNIILTHVAFKLGYKDIPDKTNQWATQTMVREDFWKDISTRLKAEEKTRKKSPCAKRSDESSTHMALIQARSAAGVPDDNIDMNAIIHHFGETLHIHNDDIVEMIRQRNFERLAEILHTDLCNIPTVFSDTEMAEADLLLNVIGAMIELWWVRDSSKPDDYKTWRKTDKLKMLSTGIRQLGYANELKMLSTDQLDHTDETIYTRIRQQIARRALSTIRRKRDEDARREAQNLHETLENELRFADEKKVVSELLSEEIEKLAETELLWCKIVDMLEGKRKMSNTKALLFR
jgi:hypothetical protein